MPASWRAVYCPCYIFGTTSTYVNKTSLNGLFRVFLLFTYAFCILFLPICSPSIKMCLNGGIHELRGVWIKITIRYSLAPIGTLGTHRHASTRIGGFSSQRFTFGSHRRPSARSARSGSHGESRRFFLGTNRRF